MEQQQNFNPFYCSCQQLDNEKPYGLLLSQQFQPNSKQKKIDYYEQKNKKQNNFLIGVPLKKIMFDINIDENLVKTKIIQEYQNEFDREVEVEYFFPNLINSCFEDFQATFESKTIKGVIKEKEQAKQEYQENLMKGNTVAYSEIISDNQDIMKINIGNLQPNSSIQIQYTYSQELEVCQNKFWKLIIPSSITPRYCSSANQEEQDQNIKIISQMPQLNYQDNEKNIKNNNPHKPYSWSFEIEINSQSPIDFIESPSHKISIMLPDENNNKKKVKVDQFSGQGKDFILLYRSNSISVPRGTIGVNRETNRYCAMVNFIPDFNNLEIEDAYKAQLEQQNNDFPVDLEYSKGEFIFILDRSGSMSGDRIKNAKVSLMIFLKSLPQESYFNIVSFGSDYSKLFEKSVHYNQQNVSFAIDEIANFEADLGGTEIYDPLHKIFQQQKIKNHPQQIFLLTDGDVTNPKKIINLIRNNTNYSRVHTIGIGDGCSHYLIQECARAGKGGHIFVKDQTDVAGSIVNLLKVALTPCLDEFSITFDHQIIEKMVPSLDQIPCIMKNQPFSIFVFFRPHINDINQIKTEIILNCFDSKLNENLKYTVLINKEDCRITEICYKLGIQKIIQTLQSSLDDHNKNNIEQHDVEIQKKDDLKNQIIQISIENQILSEQTSFLCLIKEIEDSKQQENFDKQKISSENTKILVPQIVKQKNTNQIESDEESDSENIKQSIRYRGYTSVKSRCVRKNQKIADDDDKSLNQFQLQSFDQFQLQEENADDDISLNQFQLQSQRKLKSITNKQDVLQKIILQQNISGSWQFCSDNLQLIQLNQNAYNNLIKELKKQEKFQTCNNDEIFFTMMIMFWLQNSNSEYIDRWQLIFAKANTWLNQQSYIYDKDIFLHEDVKPYLEFIN